MIRTRYQQFKEIFNQQPRLLMGKDYFCMDYARLMDIHNVYHPEYSRFLPEEVKELDGIVDNILQNKQNGFERIPLFKNYLRGTLNKLKRDPYNQYPELDVAMTSLINLVLYSLKNPYETFDIISPTEDANMSSIGRQTIIPHDILEYDIKSYIGNKITDNL